MGKKGDYIVNIMQAAISKAVGIKFAYEKLFKTDKRY